MFSVWVLDQIDREDGVGRFARVVWDDYNSGCAAMYKDAVAWKTHFEHSHGSKLGVLVQLLEDAYVEYAMSLDQQDDLI
jgi:hypothetical protein